MSEMKPVENTPAGRWVTYRPEIQVLDCTIRDGGLMNDHQFSDDIVRGVYNACVEAGIDYMEIGYKASKKLFDPAKFGPWKFCDEEDVRRIVGDNPTNLKITVMADAEKCDYQNDIIPKSESAIDLIRVAGYIHQIPIVLKMVEDAHEKGYETTINLMAVSNVQERELDEGLDLLADSKTKAVYLVDSFGHLYSEQVDYLVKKYMRVCKPRGIDVGVHMHNNLQLAYANTIEGVIMGANMLDATLAGLGRGAGNCLIELLIGFLHNPNYKIRPLLECVEKHIMPLQKELGWGFDQTYMLTGLLNLHPRSAMRFNAGEHKGNYTRFYDSLTEDL